MNPSTGRTESELNDPRGAPRAPEGADAAKLAAAKDAAKKKLLRLVISQALEELGDADSMVDTAIEDGIIDDEMLSGLRASMRSRLSRRLIERVTSGEDSGLTMDVANDAIDSEKLDSAVDAVERHLAGAIAERALAKMDDGESVVKRTFDQIAAVNDAAIGALADDVRNVLLRSIADRAWAASVDPEELAKAAQSRLDAPTPEIEATMSDMADQARAIAVDRTMKTAMDPEHLDSMTQAVAAEIEADVIRRVSEQVKAAAHGHLESNFVTDFLKSESLGALIEKAGSIIHEQVASRVLEQVTPAQLVESSLEIVTVGDEAVDQAVAQIRNQAVAHIRATLAQEFSQADWQDDIRRESVESVQGALIDRIAREIKEHADGSLPQEVAARIETDYDLTGELTRRVVESVVADVARRSAATLADPERHEMEIRAMVDGQADTIAEMTRVISDRMLGELGERIVERVTDRASLEAQVEERLAASTDVVDQVSDQVHEELMSRVSALVVARAERGLSDQVQKKLEKEHGLSKRHAREIVERLGTTAAEHVLEALASEEKINQDVKDFLRENAEAVELRTEELTKQLTSVFGRRVADSVFDTSSLMQRVEEYLGTEDHRMAEAAERARSEFAVHLTDDLIAAVTCDDSISSLTAQAVAEVRVRVAEDVARQVVESSIREMAESAIDKVDPEHENLMAAIGTVRIELLRRIADRAVHTFSNTSDAAIQALANVDVDSNEIRHAVSLVGRSLVDTVAVRAIESLPTRIDEIVDVGRNHLDSEAGLLEDASDRLHARLALDLAERAAESLRNAGIGTDDPAISAIVRDLEEAVRAMIHRETVGSLSTSESLENMAGRIAADATTRALADETTDFVSDLIAGQVSDRVLSIPASEIAGAAIDRIAPDHESLASATEMLRDELVRRIVEHTTSTLSDTGTTAAEALARIDMSLVHETARVLHEQLAVDLAQRASESLRADGIETSDPAISRIVTELEQSVRAMIHERAIGVLATPESRARMSGLIAADATTLALTDETTTYVTDLIAKRVSERILSIPSEDLTAMAADRIDSEDARIQDVGERLRKQLVEGISERVVHELGDIESATAEAADLIPEDSPVIHTVVESLQAQLTQQITERVLDELETNGLPLEDPRMAAAAQSVRTLVTGFLFAQAMKVASTAKERDKVARSVADELHELIVTDTMESFVDRDPKEIARDARSRMDGVDEFVEASVEQMRSDIAAALAVRADESIRERGFDVSDAAFAETIESMIDVTRTMITDNVAARVTESDARSQMATDIAERVQEIVTTDALNEILSKDPAHVAAVVAARITGKEPEVKAAIEDVLERLKDTVQTQALDALQDEEVADLAARELIEGDHAAVESFMRHVAEALRDHAGRSAVSEVSSDSEVEDLAESAYGAIRERLVAAVAHQVVQTDVMEIAGDAAAIMGETPAVASNAIDLLHARLVEMIAAGALNQLGSVAAASEKARIVAESEREAIEDATRAVIEALSAGIGGEVSQRIRQTDRMAESASAYVNPDDPALLAAADAVSEDLGRLVAVRAVEQLSTDETRDRIADQASEACEPEIDETVLVTEKTLMDRIVARTAERFADAGETARRAQERLGSDHAPLIAATEVLKELVLEDLAKKASIFLLDAAKAADRAFARIDLDDPRYAGAQRSLVELVENTMAERTLQSLEDHESAAGMVRARISDDHEAIIGTAALVRDMLLDEIAVRSEASMTDARQIAKQSLSRVPAESTNLTAATEALRDLLLEDVIRMTKDAFSDAHATAELAMEQVDSNDEVLTRARSVFKERVLMSVLGEAIREIGGSVGASRPDAQMAIFRQAMSAMAHEGQPIPVPVSGVHASRQDGPAVSHDEPASGIVRDEPSRTSTKRSAVAGQASDRDRSDRTKTGRVERRTDSEPDVRATSRVSADAEKYDAQMSTSMDMTSADEGWTRLSDIEEEQGSDFMDRSIDAMPDPEPLAPIEDVIVTEFVEMNTEADEEEPGDDTFSFSWAMDGEASGDTSPVESAEVSADVASPRPQEQHSGDGARQSIDDIDMTWAADDGNVCYVYGFIPVGESSESPDANIEGMDPEHEVRYVTVRGIRAVVSTVAAEDFGPDVISTRSRDGEWLRDKIRTHARVLDAFKNRNTVIPLRFGSVFQNESEVAVMVDSRYAALTAAIERLRGKGEWGVRAVRNSDRMRTHILKSGRSVEESLDTLSAGVAQFVRDELGKSHDLSEDALIDIVTSNCLNRADDALRQWADEGVEKAANAGSPDIVMNRAYLVEQTAIASFRAEVKRLGGEFEALGISFEITGPWPPFHFADMDDNDSTGSVPVHG